MKHTLLIIITSFSITSFAQLTPDPIPDAFDLANYDSSTDPKNGRFDYIHGNDVTQYSSNVAATNVNAYLVDLNANDTAFVVFTVGSLTAGENGSGATHDTHDTLTLEGRFVTYSNTASPVCTFFNKYDSYSHSGFGGVNAQSSVWRSFKFVEGETDTLFLVVNSGYVELDYIGIRTDNSEIISEATNGNSAIENAIISNPVSNDMLSINLQGNTANFELVSLEGNVLKSFEVNDSDEISVNDIDAGMYILREANTANYRKIIIR